MRARENYPTREKAIFTRARVSLALLSLRKNGGLLAVYCEPNFPLAESSSRRKIKQATRNLHLVKTDYSESSI